LGAEVRRHSALHEEHVPGIDVPDEIVARLSGAPKARRRKRPEDLRRADPADPRDPGVAGVHIMAIEWEEAVAGIVEAAGVKPPTN